MGITNDIPESRANLKCPCPFENPEFVDPTAVPKRLFSPAVNPVQRLGFSVTMSEKHVGKDVFEVLKKGAPLIEPLIKACRIPWPHRFIIRSVVQNSCAEIQ